MTTALLTLGLVYALIAVVVAFTDRNASCLDFLNSLQMAVLWIFFLLK